MAPRLFNGAWDKNPNDGFTEGSPWTYLFCAMQDVPGLIKLMGGKGKFASQLDQNFEGHNYKPDNEPQQHYIYLYDYCDQAWKTQKLIHEETIKNYQNKPNGINGNDDCGQMSAWYIFSVMGFYPVTPASGIYAVGAPQYPKLTLSYDVNGQPHQLEIVANHISDKNKYVQSLKLDGLPVIKPFISHQEIINGHKLVFEMGPKPNYSWK
jgi:predicted alpha-1,2-mannosidase